ncbi:MAG: glycosyltransferase [Desulfuromonadales bacterium]
MKPKLIYIIDNLILAGTEVHLFNLAKGMKEAGYSDLEVLSMSGEGEIFDWMAINDIPVKNFRMKSVRNPIFFVDMVRLIFYLIKQSPDIVHTYLDTANVFGVIAAKCAGVKRIMTSRRDLGVFRSRRMEIMMGKLSNGVEKIVCVCKAAASESMRRENLCGNNIMVIHNGIKLDTFKSEFRVISAEAPVFCNVAVPNRTEKGHSDLIAAFAIVLQSVPMARLRLVGDGWLLPVLRSQADQLGIDQSIEFYGKSLDIPSVMKDVSVFVIPSHSEGISNALLEAMAMGIPAVATDVGGNPDVVTHGVTGVLVEAKSPESIAQGMLNIISDKNKLLSMSLAAQEVVKKEFNYSKMISAYDDLYSNPNE